MRLSLRFIVPLVLALAAIAYAVVPLVDRLTIRWFERDLDSRSNLIANTVQEPLREFVRTGNRVKVAQLFTSITRDERVYAVGFCASSSSRIVATPTLPSEVGCANLGTLAGAPELLVDTEHGPLYVSVRPLADAEGVVGSL